MVRAGSMEPLVKFSPIGGGLVARDGEWRGFTLARPDKVFHPARATIAGDTVEVGGRRDFRAERGALRVSERSGGNLFHRAGLPASPFATDSE